MNFYLIEPAEEHQSPEILAAIKRFLKERFPGAVEDSLVNLTYDSPNLFFLKTPAGMIGVRMLGEILTRHELPHLHRELERVSSMFHQKIRFYLFAPDYEPGLKMTLTVPLEMLFFEYFFVRSRFGQGIALRESKIEFLEASSGVSKNTAQEKVSPKEKRPQGHFGNARLDREELSELINLSLELKSPAPSSPFLVS